MNNSAQGVKGLTGRIVFGLACFGSSEMGLYHWVWDSQTEKQLQNDNGISVGQGKKIRMIKTYDWPMIIDLWLDWLYPPPQATFLVIEKLAKRFYFFHYIYISVVQVHSKRIKSLIHKNFSFVLCYSIVFCYIMIFLFFAIRCTWHWELKG